jgi:hypothetical protein
MRFQDNLSARPIRIRGIPYARRSASPLSGSSGWRRCPNPVPACPPERGTSGSCRSNRNESCHRRACASRKVKQRRDDKERNRKKRIRRILGLRSQRELVLTPGFQTHEALWAVAKKLPTDFERELLRTNITFQCQQCCLSCRNCVSSRIRFLPRSPTFKVSLTRRALL